MLADHQQTHGQRRRQQQSGNTPQPRPENGRQQDRHGRHAGVLAVEPRFHDVVAEEFQHHEQRTVDAAAQSVAMAIDRPIGIVAAIHGPM